MDETPQPHGFTHYVRHYLFASLVVILANVRSRFRSIGAPWEIVRYVNPETGKVTDIYTKLGDSGAYGGQVAIIPDYGCGWTFLNGTFLSSYIFSQRMY